MDLLLPALFEVRKLESDQTRNNFLTDAEYIVPQAFNGKAAFVLAKSITEWRGGATMAGSNEFADVLHDHFNDIDKDQSNTIDRFELEAYANDKTAPQVGRTAAKFALSHFDDMTNMAENSDNRESYPTLTSAGAHRGLLVDLGINQLPFVISRKDIDVMQQFGSQTDIESRLQSLRAQETHAAKENAAYSTVSGIAALALFVAATRGEPAPSLLLGGFLGAGITGAISCLTGASAFSDYHHEGSSQLRGELFERKNKIDSWLWSSYRG